MSFNSDFETDLQSTAVNVITSTLKLEAIVRLRDRILHGNRYNMALLPGVFLLNLSRANYSIPKLHYC